MHSLSSRDTTTTYSREKPDEVSSMDDGYPLQFGRDETLSLFHALGKFLHNKRETESAMALGMFCEKWLVILSCICLNV